MFILFHLLVVLPLLLCSFLAGCSKDAAGARVWTAVAMAMPTLLWGLLCCMSLGDGRWHSAGVALLMWLLCYAASRLIRALTPLALRLLRHVWRVLTGPYEEPGERP